jgi:hypothetical protein
MMQIIRDIKEDKMSYNVVVVDDDEVICCCTKIFQKVAHVTETFNSAHKALTFR